METPSFVITCVLFLLLPLSWALMIGVGPLWTAQWKSRLLAVINLSPIEIGVTDPKRLPEPTVSKANDFPDDWWTSEHLFALEKRAIFSKTWLHVCHTSLLPNPGDFQTVAIANFSILIVRGKDGQLRTFHNACRHRAYPVTNKSNGHANLLMCGYHGWTYNINGKLIQAPKFEGLNGFDKRQNGLFELRSFTDSSGFLYTNADVYGSDGLTIRVGVPLRATLHLVDHWTVEADFNWKIAMAPGVFTVSSLASSKRGLNLFARASANLESWSCPAELQLSPLTRVLRSSTSGLCLTVSMSPISQEKTAIQCALYTSSVRKLEDHLSEAVKRDVEESISRLRDQFTEAVLQGSIPHATHQEPLLAEIKAHSKLERLMGQEIHPASRLRETTQACKVADDLCKELEAEEGKRGRQSQVGGLAW